VTTYASAGGKVSSVAQQTISLDDVSSSLTQTGSSTLSIPADTKVMKRDATQQVFLVLQYHFGMS
jgi:hypothetical protein